MLFFAHFRPNARFSCAKWLTFLVLYVKIEQKKRSCPYRFATEYGFCCKRGKMKTERMKYYAGMALADKTFFGE